MDPNDKIFYLENDELKRCLMGEFPVEGFLGSTDKIKRWKVSKNIKILTFDGLRQPYWVTPISWNEHSAEDVYTVTLGKHKNKPLTIRGGKDVVFGIKSETLAPCTFDFSDILCNKNIFIPFVVHLKNLEPYRISEIPVKQSSSARYRLKPTIKLTEKFGYLCGYLIAYGAFSPEKKSRVYAKFFASEELRRKFEDGLAELFQGPCPEGNEYTNFDSYHGAALYTFLHGLLNHPNAQGRKPTRLPPWYFLAPEEFKFALLCGLIGKTAYVGHSGEGSDGYPVLKLYLWGKSVAEEVSILAQSLGLRAQIAPEGGKQSLVLININDVCSRKDDWKRHIIDKRFLNFIEKRVKNGVPRELREFIPFPQIIPDMPSPMRTSNHPSKAKVRKMLPELEARHYLFLTNLKLLLDNINVTWEKIKNIIPKKSQVTYSFTVPKTGTYVLQNGIVANGLLPDETGE